MRWDEAVIFAGGRSTRMGQDKALLPFGGYRTLAEYQYRRLQPLFGQVLLSAKTPKFPFDAPVILDRDEDRSSPMVALASVLAYSTKERVFVLSVDMPFVDEALIRRLHEALEDHRGAQIAYARSPRGAEPLCAVYCRSLLPRVESLLTQGEHRMRALIGQVESVEVPCERDEIFVNLNTPQDYERYKEL